MVSRWVVSENNGLMMKNNGLKTKNVTSVTSVIDFFTSNASVFL
jgi:hypothetical protein